MKSALQSEGLGLSSRTQKRAGISEGALALQDDGEFPYDFASGVLGG